MAKVTQKWVFGIWICVTGSLHLSFIVLSCPPCAKCAQCSEKTPCTSTLLRAQSFPAHRHVWEIPTKGLLAELCNLVMAVARYTAAMARTFFVSVSPASADCLRHSLDLTPKLSISCGLVKPFDLAASPSGLAGS